MVDVKTLKQSTKDLTILYAEDDMPIQKSMISYLSKFFLTVKAVGNGEEGLEAYKQDWYDIVMTDISMPKMDGLEMIKIIKDENPSQVVLITTAHYDAQYMLSAIENGVDGYIIKPFKNMQLQNELFKAAQKIMMRKENEAYKLYLNTMVKDKTRELEDLVHYQSDNYEKTLVSMVEMIEQRDTYTAGHSRRVAEYSKMIAQGMGCTKEECTLIYQAGILHDVGKIGTPDAVLLNPKNLNDLEYKLIQGHVSVSYKLLSSIPMFESMAEIVYSHHERYDGKGYPRGLKDKEISKLASIMIVADSFDAMTTNRIYKARKTVEQVINEIEALSTKQFDPEVVKNVRASLRNVLIDESVNQLPQTKLEDERFAYFYKDSVSEAYNQNYLDVVLMKNVYDTFFNQMIVISIKKFSAFNKELGWKFGDKVLHEVADVLIQNYPNSYVFRIFGDDFVLISEKKQNTQKLNSILKKTLDARNLNFKIDTIDLKNEKISQISQIESIQTAKE